VSLPWLPVRGRWPAWLPRGGGLPDGAWQARHRVVMALLWAHVVAIPLYGMYRGNSFLHAWADTGLVAAAALVAGFARLGRAVSSSIAAAGLMICSGVIVHLSGGMIEAHFHFFVMIPVIALYEAWAPFTLAVAYVLLHHGLMGTLHPNAVYNHPAARERPWVFAGVHAAFFAFASIACIANWWLHERARLAAHSQSRLLGTIVDSLRDGLIVLDAKGDVLLRNPAGSALLGGVTPGDNKAGAPERYGLSRPDGSPVTEKDLLFEQTLASEDVHDFDLLVRNPGVPDGRVLSFSATALPSTTGEDHDVVMVFRDVTERHRTEQALSDALSTEQAAVERLRELERVKSDFVSTVSHELRTPITSIIGYLEVLAEGALGDLEPAQLALVGRVDRNSHRLLRLVEDLLKLSQIEASTLTVDLVPTDLCDVVASAREAIGWMLDARTLDVAVDLPADDVRLDGDPAELERMLVNLLSNAVKFTPDGGRVEVALSADEHGATLVVTDTGIGIPEAEQDQLFSRFFRSTTAIERAIQGTGLGLTIVQAIVALHHGTIDVASHVDRGTRVTVRLPRRPRIAAVA
jgi:signal transduction histidine kinase